MALQKQNLNINFSQGLDTKTDPFQVRPGKFLSLINTVFNKGGQLTKRFGFPQLPSLPNLFSKYLTTFNGNLTAIGTGFNAYSESSMTWVSKGSITPVQLDTLPLIRSGSNQTQVDSAIAPNGLICTVYTDVGTSTVYKYAIANSITGQNIVSPIAIPVTSGTVTLGARVFVLGRYFVIVFNNVITAVNHIQYIAISIANPTLVSANVDVSSAYTPSTNLAFDGVVANDTLYLAWNANTGGGAVKACLISSTLVQSSVVTFATRVATIISVCADTSGGSPNIYISFYNLGTTSGYTIVLDASLNTITGATQIIAAGTVLNITSTATSGSANVIFEVDNAYSYDSSIKTNLIKYLTFSQAGSIGSTVTVVRSVGLASKAFIYSGITYFLGAYSSAYQPSYFLFNLSGQAVAKLAYSNGGGYLALGLPSVTINDSVISIAYLFKDLVVPINKDQGATQSAGVYAQKGINLVNFDITTDGLISSEIGGDLHLNGGFLWMYDGYLPVEHGFHLWPDSVEVTTSTTGGHLSDQDYYYIAVYEWTDNQGNIFRSAPSIPVKQTTTGGTTSTNTINVPTLRITYKTANPIKITLFRWSTAQQTYYQVTSISTPTFNSVTVDSVAIVDTVADASIIGNSILYTTGGVVENIAAPATLATTLFKSRMFLIDAEDRNLIWYSKQVIESTPVEMSDLFTIYVAPTIGAQGDTGKLTCLSSMDDKLIMFKKDAIYYLTGNGPDITGANNDFSEPIFITGTVGCSNQNSIVFTPNGLMFQSGKGIWLLGRDLSTTYIGADVAGFNQYAVLSALSIPGTNQVRFTMSNDQTLMYDYYYNQWGVFQGIAGISSTLFEGMHTFIDQYGRAFQEEIDTYLDGSRPVLMSFVTSWFNLAGLQGYERAYYFYILGQFISPHKINIQVAYDYNPSPSQFTVITPENYNAPWGSDETWGQSTPWGGSQSLEQWRVFMQQQRCQSFQIYFNEIFDSTYGTTAGAGLTLSGLNLVCGLKKGWIPILSKNTVG